MTLAHNTTTTKTTTAIVLIIYLYTYIRGIAESPPPVRVETRSSVGGWRWYGERAFINIKTRVCGYSAVGGGGGGPFRRRAKKRLNEK